VAETVHLETALDDVAGMSMSYAVAYRLMQQSLMGLEVMQVIRQAFFSTGQYRAPSVVCETLQRDILLPPRERPPHELPA
jgi:hypothetical protein